MSDGGEGVEQSRAAGFFSCVFSEQCQPAGVYAAWAEFAGEARPLACRAHATQLYMTPMRRSMRPDG